MNTESSGFNSVAFAKKVLMTIGIIIPVLLLLWFLGSIFQLILLLFAAVLIHCFFMSFAQFIHRVTKLPMGWAKLASVIIVLAVVFFANWLLASPVSDQINMLMTKLPQSLNASKDYLQHHWWGRTMLTIIQDGKNLLMSNNRSYFLGFFSTTFGILGNLYVIILFAGYFLVNPRPYVNGVVDLFPKSKRKRIKKTIHTVYRTLQLWLEGKLLSMLFVAILISIGLYFLGVPLALVLGLMAGLLGFIPNFGHFISVIPAAFIAIPLGMSYVLYVILLYIVVMVIEGSFFTPIVQHHMISMPFAMILIAQVAFGFLTGILGLILATPIVAAIIVAVKMLYVHDVLGDESAEVEYK
jgi:predicted PurR-regulated permease PerM